MAPDRSAPVVIRWPADQDRRRELADLGVPRLLLVDSDATPPICTDPLEDWIRLPSDERDIDARMNGLRARASSWAPSTRPELDGHGRLLRGTRWVPLSPIEEQLCTLLIGEFGQVVSDTELIARAWPEGTGTPTGLRLQMTRLRRRIADLQLEVRSVRGKGYVLQNQPALPGGAR
ncbi:MAG TPA: winged helix-turn-helix domain-containing protein [Acidimicrobiia bacterium]|nr:winged helix-turn-helix domain-containing protein [Acidimicrobiia bacterium]HMC79519.1 winged helix-turn-helix domain-containing protein [Acidimicrobiia bacterium]